MTKVFTSLIVGNDDAIFATELLQLRAKGNFNSQLTKEKQDLRPKQNLVSIYQLASYRLQTEGKNHHRLPLVNTSVHLSASVIRARHLGPRSQPSQASELPGVFPTSSHKPLPHCRSSLHLCSCLLTPRCAVRLAANLYLRAQSCRRTRLLVL